MSEKQQLRLALRTEGHDWVAYCAMNNTMKGALELGRVKMAIVQDPARKKAFMDLMKDAIVAMLSDQGNENFHWHDPVSAPEHERSGRG